VRSAQRFCWTIYDSKPAIIPRLRPPPSTDAWASWSARCATSFLIRPARSRPGFTMSIGGVRLWATAVPVHC
jgi:hypothetical protein